MKVHVPPPDRAAFVREARAQLGWSVYDAARALGLEDPTNNGGLTVRRWENGDRLPSGPVCVALQALLDGWRPETKG